MAEKPKVTSAGSINVSKQFAANKSTGSAAAKPAAKTAVSGGYSGIPSTTKNVPVFTYGLGSSTQTKITKPGQTLPTTGGKSTGGKSTGGGKQPGVGKETGSTNTFIPGYTPSGTDTGPGGSTENTCFPAAGTFAGWEYSGDKKQRRMKFHDGQGGFYYGSFEANPDYKEDDEKKKVANVAYDTIQKILESYRITGLASVLESIREEYPEASSEDLLTLLQFDLNHNYYTSHILNYID